MKFQLLMICLLLTSAVTTASAGDRVYTIQDAYVAALKENEVVKLSEESIVQAESRVDQAWTYLYPRLTARGAYTRYNEVLPPGGGGGFIFQPLDQINTALVLTQPLYTGGRTLAALRVAKTMRESSRSDLSATKQTLLLGVAEAYYAVLKAQKLVEVSKNSLERMERHKKVTEREAETRRTKANISALLRANTLVNQARITLVRAEDGLTIARQKLSLLTKLPKDITVSEPSSLAAPQGTLESMQETALKNRDDYTSSQLNQQVAKEFVTITEGAHYPQVYAEGGMTYQHSHPETDLDATVYYGGIRLQIPLFEGGLMKAEVAEAKSKQRQAELATVLLRRQIESDVQEAYITYRTISYVLETARLQFADANKNFDTVEGLFSEGLLASLSLIDAEQALSLAEQELVNATYDEQLAILRLKKSIGTLGMDDGIMKGDNHAST
jgi:outer membrane protein